MATKKIVTPNEEMWARSNAAWSGVINAALEVLAIQQPNGIHCSDIIEWSRLCGTVRLHCGVHTGLTSWITSVATPDDLIVCANNSTAESVRRTQNPKAPVISMLALAALDSNPRYTYVDGASLLNPQQLQRLYEATARTADQRWFLLG